MANKIYQLQESAVTFEASGGTVTFTLTSLGAAAGRISADRSWAGTGVAFSPWYVGLAKVKFATAPVIGEVISFHAVPSDGTDRASDLGASDAALTDIAELHNSIFLGNIVVHEASTTPDFIGFLRNTVPIPFEHWSLAAWNHTADALSATAGDHKVTIWPVPFEVQ